MIRRHNPIIFVLLAGLLWATRATHFGSASFLPDASWAVLFGAGYLLGMRAWAALLALAVGIDALAFGGARASDQLLTSSYACLQFAHIALLLAGRALRENATAASFSRYAIGSVIFAFFVSNTGYYWLSGHFEATSVMGYLRQFNTYLWPYLTVSLGYILAGALVVLAASRTRALSAVSPQREAA
ncbi:MAG: hypothetical protein EB068_02220 [Betaproteobacteria bacterium]|nr:hypothetical protein [Betaproteobacteria bacterium]